jgi:histidinol-phosphatase (PHP family)
MILDYHIHTPYCGHAQGAIVDYVENAIKVGAHEIGFADHLGRYYLSQSQKRRYWDWGMDEGLLDRYWNELSDVREVYKGRITIRVGLEVDFVEGAEDKVKPFLKRHPFDFFLASIHCVPEFGWHHLSEISRGEPEEIFDRYFALAEAALESGLFSALAHPDFVWRYVKWPRNQTARIFEQIDWLAQTAARCNKAIEINVNGYLWSQLYQIKGGDPFEVLLDKILQNNVSITLGSDAHSPTHVAKEFPRLIQTLKAKGITSVASFDGQRRMMVELG